MNIFTIILAMLSPLIVIFILVYIRPLNEDELRELAMKRRNKVIRTYYTFSRNETQANDKFKKYMKPDGRFYNIKERLYDFPSVAAALLKYKKHEWVMVAFEKDSTVDLLWLNKGADNKSAEIFISFEELSDIAVDNNSTTVLFFHNHPNSNPKLYDCSKPSDIDISSAQIFANILNSKNVNLIEFVCEKGMHYEYYRFIADDFNNIIDFINALNKENNDSRLDNLSLHIERLF
jgi:hypothetical protein